MNIRLFGLKCQLLFIFDLRILLPEVTRKLLDLSQRSRSKYILLLKLVKPISFAYFDIGGSYFTH